MKHTSKLLSLLLIIALALFAVSAGIALPILWRGFYYLHIDALELPAQTSFDKATIRSAYDEMMDFCVKRAPFGTGALRWSEEGMRHFADVAVLFRLDLTVLFASTLSLVLLYAVSKKVQPFRFAGCGPSFFAGTGILACSAVLTVLAALDFDRAFVIFHHLFFPGKTNWIFDYRTDEIILILPQDYFRNCAILAVSAVALFCLVYILAGLRGRRRARQ